MADIIPFPFRKLDVVHQCDPLDERMKELKKIVLKISHGIQNGKLNLAVFVVDPKLYRLTQDALYKLESRLLVRTTRGHRGSRHGLYLYPSYHVILMTPPHFSQDRCYLEQLAQVNKVVLVSDKKRKLNGAKVCVIGDDHG